MTLEKPAFQESADRHLSAQRPTTNQQLVGRLAMEQLGAGASGKLVAGQDVVEERMPEA